MWWPGYRQGMHAIFVLHHMRDIHTVFATTGRNDHVVAAILASVLIQDFMERFLPGLIIDRFPLAFVLPTRGANVFVINVEWIFLVDVFKLDRR